MAVAEIIVMASVQSAGCAAGLWLYRQPLSVWLQRYGAAIVLVNALMFGVLAMSLNASPPSVVTTEQWSDDYDFAVRNAGPPKTLDSYFVIQTDQDGRREATWRRLNEQP